MKKYYLALYKCLAKKCKTVVKIEKIQNDGKKQMEKKVSRNFEKWLTRNSRNFSNYNSNLLVWGISTWRDLSKTAVFHINSDENIGVLNI